MVIMAEQNDLASGQRPSPPVRDAIGLARLTARHRALRHLCNALEACADRLPDRQVIAQAILVSASLVAGLREPDADGHGLLHELAAGDTSEAMAALLHRIRQCHAIDQLQAEDLHDMLETAATSPAPIRSEMLGYMMRCLFDGRRRAIASEEAAILMLLHDRTAAPPPRG